MATVTSVTKNLEAEFDDDDGIEKHMLEIDVGTHGELQKGGWG